MEEESSIEIKEKIAEEKLLSDNIEKLSLNEQSVSSEINNQEVMVNGNDH